MNTFDLVRRLEAATEGSRELDSAIGKIVNLPTMTSREYERWTPPHYTTSIDAKLPWENIIEVRQGKRWKAVQSEFWCAKQHFVGMAQTEPLARRSAALKAKQTDG